MAKVQLNVWVSERDREALKGAAKARGVSLGQLVVEAVFGGGGQDVPDRLEDHEQRICALERLAQGSGY